MLGRNFFTLLINVSGEIHIIFGFIDFPFSFQNRCDHFLGRRFSGATRDGNHRTIFGAQNIIPFAIIRTKTLYVAYAEPYGPTAYRFSPFYGRGIMIGFRIYELFITLFTPPVFKVTRGTLAPVCQTGVRHANLLYLASVEMIRQLVGSLLSKLWGLGPLTHSNTIMKSYTVLTARKEVLDACRKLAEFIFGWIITG